MEATKEVEGPDPSGLQSHPLPGSQQLKGGLRGPQGPWTSSRPLNSTPGLPLSTGSISDGSHILQPIHQVSQDPAQVSFQCNHAQASQDAQRLTSMNPSLSHIVGGQQNLTMDNRTPAPPTCTHNDSTSDNVQYPLGLPRLQVHIGRESKAPAKVLVGWGKGPCDNDQMAALGPRKSRWLPCFLSGNSSTVEGENPLLVLAQTPAQDQEQGKCSGQAPAPASTTASLQSMAPPPPTTATTPALSTTPTSAVVESYTGIPDHRTDTTLGIKGLSQDLRSCSNLPPTLLEPSQMDKVNLSPRKEPPTPAPTPEEFPACAQEHEAARRQVPHEDLAKSLLFCNSKPGIPVPIPEPPGVPQTQRSSQKTCSSQLDKQPPNACNNNSTNVPPSAYETCHKQPPFNSPREATQIPFSSAPTCQHQDAMEDHVMVFDMATGNSRMGLLCHDPMGSRAVLVGLTRNNPSSLVPENTPSARPLPRPILSPNSTHSNFWSTTAMMASPVPSSLSSGSYPEVALASKEAKHNLTLLNSPGTPPSWMPVQLGEKILTHVPDPSWSKPDAERNEPSRTIWMLQSSTMQDPKKLQWVKSDLIQVEPGSLLQKEAGSHNQKVVIAAQSDHSQAEDSEQVFLTGQTFLNGQNLLSRKLPVAEQGSLSGHPLSTTQLPLVNLPPVTGKPPLFRQLSLSRQVPLTVKSPITKEPPLSRGPLISGEPGQASVQQNESLSLPAHVGILRVPLAPEEACVYVNRDEAVINNAQSSSVHRLPACWQPGSSHRGHEEQLPLITFTGCKELPVTMVGAEPHGGGHPFKLTAEDITRSSVLAQLSLLRGNCYELVSTMDALPVQSPVICHHSSGPYQTMAAIVIDTGTGFTKCGLAGEDHVLSVVPSRVQMIRHSAQGQAQYVVPENQEGSYSVLNRGVISDWDALEVLWQHLFYCRLRVQPEELAVLVADSPISPRTNREKVAEILFERFRVPAMQTVHQALLTLYAYGRTTGLVVGSGYGTSYVAPILTGDLAPLGTYRLDVAGVDLTNYLARLLLKGGCTPPREGLVRQIKESCCYVAMDMASEMAHNQSPDRVDFMLPDKQVISLGSERFRCPEALFQPNLLGLNQPGLPQLALLSISGLEATQQEQLLANVVLEGGSTLVSGFPERLRQDLGPGATVLGSPHRAVAAWLGGSIMASRDSFQTLWLSRREYEEEGPWAIYKYQL
uniref:Actin-like 11 n=1 Tax=Jaculus jaculus TaxID=51337 RepID=A0A8C5NXE6_JACJA